MATDRTRAAPAVARGRSPRPQGLSGDVVAAEDLQRLLKGLNLLLAPRDAVLVAHPRVIARGLQLVEVAQGSIELFLSGLQVLLLGNQHLRQVLFLGLAPRDA